MDENDRALIERLRTISPHLGSIIQALLVTRINEETLLQTIYELDDLGSFNRWGKVEITVENGNVTRVVGQRSKLINQPLRNKD